MQDTKKTLSSWLVANNVDCQTKKQRNIPITLNNFPANILDKFVLTFNHFRDSSPGFDRFFRHVIEHLQGILVLIFRTDLNVVSRLSSKLLFVESAMKVNTTIFRS